MLKRFFASTFLALVFVMAMGFTALPGCAGGIAALGVPAADTFNKKAAEAYLGVTTAANLVVTLRGAGKMGEADRDRTVAALKTTKSGIDAAVHLSASNPGQALTDLDRAMLVLNALTAALTAQQAGVK